MQASEQTHNYGYVPPDSTRDWELTLTNQARQNVTVLGITADSAAYHVAFNDSLTLEPGANGSVRVTFSPSQSRVYSGDLTIHTARRDLHIGLTGTGMPLSASGNSDILSVFALSTPYPNPFNSSTTVSVSLPTSEAVTIKLMDISGRVILEKTYGRLGVGKHNLTLSAEGVPSGVYLLQATVGGKTMMRKAAVMK